MKKRGSRLLFVWILPTAVMRKKISTPLMNKEIMYREEDERKVLKRRDILEEEDEGLYIMVGWNLEGG